MTQEVDRAVQEIIRARMRTEPSPPAAGPADEGASSLQSAGPSVLLVMEDLFFRKLVRRQLEEAGYDVFEALSVDRAIARIDSDMPSLVLLDTWVDHGTGLIVLETIRASEDLRHLPVLLVGRDSRGDVRQRAEQLGALGPVPISRAVGVNLWVDAALFGHTGTT